MKLRRIVLCGLALAAMTGAGAQTVYRWVDDAGQVHFSDVVPEAFRNVARPMDLKTAEPSPAEKAASEARAAAQKAAADRIVPLAPDPTPEPPPTLDRTTDAFRYTAANCKAWRQRYTRSKACFDGFGSPDDRPTSAAASSCGEDVPNPYPVCGAPENYEIEPSDAPWFNIPPHRRR